MVGSAEKTERKRNLTEWIELQDGMTTIRRFTNDLEKKLNWNLGCSLLLVGVLASAFLFYLWAQNLGKYTLQPEQSISLQVVVSYIMI